MLLLFLVYWLLLVVLVLYWKDLVHHRWPLLLLFNRKIVPETLLLIIKADFLLTEYDLLAFLTVIRLFHGIEQVISR